MIEKNKNEKEMMTRNKTFTFKKIDASGFGRMFLCKFKKKIWNRYVFKRVIHIKML